MSKSQPKSDLDKKVLSDEVVIRQTLAFKREKYAIVRECARRGVLPSRTNLSMHDRLQYCYWRMSERFGLERGQEDAVLKELVGKSLKQVSRYFDGAEVPFSVVYTFALAANVPVGWIAGDKYIIDKDRRRLRSPVINIEDKKGTDEPRWADRLMVRAAAETLRYVPGLPDIDQVGDVSVDQSRPNESGGVLPPEYLDEWTMEELAKIVLREYKEAGLTLPPSKVAVQASALYNELVEMVRDTKDHRTVGAVLPLLAENLRSKLKKAVAEPGTGKRRAS